MGASGAVPGVFRLNGILHRLQRGRKESKEGHCGGMTEVSPWPTSQRILAYAIGFERKLAKGGALF